MQVVLVATLGALVLVAAWALYDRLDRHWQLSRILRRRFRRKGRGRAGSVRQGRGPLNLLLVLVAAMALWVLAILLLRAMAH